MLLILGALAAVCVGSLGAVLTVEAQVKDPDNGKVLICHYPGHDGDERIGGKEILACEEGGGNAMKSPRTRATAMASRGAGQLRNRVEDRCRDEGVAAATLHLSKS